MTRFKCTKENCDDDVSCRGLCNRHYQQARRTKEVTNLPPHVPTLCKKPECESNSRTRGYCPKHYGQAKQLNEFDEFTCTEADCTKGQYARGMCARHYRQASRQGRWNYIQCKEPGCESHSDANGFCGKHHHVAKLRGDFQDPECTVPECVRLRHTAKGYCQPHARKTRLYPELDTPEKLAYYDRDTVCDICKTRKAQDIDHCHNSNKVRGYLCHNCNMGLGAFKDNIGWLTEAAKYLKHSAALG